MTIQNIGIVGYGSIGQKHHQILASLSDDFQFSILTQQKGIQNSFNSLESFVKVDLDYIIISNPTSLHYESLQFLDAQYKKIKFLIDQFTDLRRAATELIPTTASRGIFRE
jgi:predicted dehydrogenase